MKLKTFKQLLEEKPDISLWHLALLIWWRTLIIAFIISLLITLLTKANDSSPQSKQYETLTHYQNQTRT